MDIDRAYKLDTSLVIPAWGRILMWIGGMVLAYFLYHDLWMRIAVPAGLPAITAAQLFLLRYLLAVLTYKTPNVDFRHMLEPKEVREAVDSRSALASVAFPPLVWIFGWLYWKLLS